jgi:uncharacterized protein DUF3105
VAKKARTPAPPRRVQAPKRRDTPKPAAAAQAQRQRTILYALGASGFVLLGAVVLVMVLASRGGIDVAAAMQKAGGTFKTYPNQGRSHVASLTAKVKYNSFPPTSGSHFVTPAIWDVYERPVNEIQAVHNLEHGGIIIQYGSRVPPGTVNQIVQFYRESPNGMLVAPLPRLGNKIALTAWTHLATITSFDKAAFTAFRDAYRGRGPERYPLDALQPGT